MLRYAITDRARGAGGEDALLRQVERLAEAGVDFVQLREKDLEAAALAALARKVLAVLRAHPTAPKLLINSRTDVAVAVGADGVHLTSAAGGVTAADVRAVYALAGRPEPIVSVSCHNLAEVAAVSGADFILFGPVFEKVVGDDVLVAEGIGLNQLHLACAAVAPTPVLALGGVTAENAAAALAAGAAGIAGIRLFLR
jgi:thiamine-phosphate pyrophosphorylase